MKFTFYLKLLYYSITARQVSMHLFVYSNIRSRELCMRKVDSMTKPLQSTSEQRTG